MRLRGSAGLPRQRRGKGSPRHPARPAHACCASPGHACRPRQSHGACRGAGRAPQAHCGGRRRRAPPTARRSPPLPTHHLPSRPHASPAGTAAMAGGLEAQTDSGEPRCQATKGDGTQCSRCGGAARPHCLPGPPRFACQAQQRGPCQPGAGRGWCAGEAALARPGKVGFGLARPRCCCPAPLSNLRG